MSRKKSLLVGVCALGLVALWAILAGTRILAAPDSPAASFSIPWWTVDNGGGASQGGTYRLSGTIGQPDAGSSSGGSFTLDSGFWSGTFEYETYFPLVKR
jgi:hypothetical protein